MTYKVVAVSYEKSLVLGCATQSQSKLTISDPIVEQMPRYIRNLSDHIEVQRTPPTLPQVQMLLMHMLEMLPMFDTGT
jgi:hypothetical protein